MRLKVGPKSSSCNDKGEDQLFQSGISGLRVMQDSIVVDRSLDLILLMDQCHAYVVAREIAKYK